MTTTEAAVASGGASVHGASMKREWSAPGLVPIRVAGPRDAIDLSPRRARASAPALATLPTPDVLESDIAHLGPGATIHLGPGDYGHLIDMTPRRGWVTVSGMGDRRRPVIDGADLWGAQRIRFIDIDFQSGVDIDHSPVYHSAQPARDIQVLDSAVDCGSNTTSPGSQGFLVRGGSSDVSLDDDWVHRCVQGFGSLPEDPVSTDVSIEHCLFSDLTGDGLVLGAMKDLVIKDDVVTDIVDPAATVHNDAIALFGNTDDVQIIDDVLSNSRVDLILAEPAYAGSTTHTSTNRHILVENDLLYGAGAVAVYDDDIVDARFTDDTLWHNHLGSLWMLVGPSRRRVPYTVVADDLIQGYLQYGVKPAVERDNMICDPEHRYDFGPADLVDVPAQFADLARGDFALKVGSSGFGAGISPLRIDQGVGDDAFQIPFGRDPSIGAVQPADPEIAWGKPRRGSEWDPKAAPRANC